MDEIRTKRLARPCERCNISFNPTGRFVRVCDPCREMVKRIATMKRFGK